MNIRTNQYSYNPNYKINKTNNPFERRKEYSNSLGSKNYSNRPYSNNTIKRSGNPYQPNNNYNYYNLNYYPILKEKEKEKEKQRQNNFYDIINKTAKYNFNNLLFYENKKESPTINHKLDDDKYKYNKTNYFPKEKNENIPKRFQYGGRYEYFNDDFPKQLDSKTEIYKFQKNNLNKNNNENKDNMYRTTYHKNSNEKHLFDDNYYRNYFNENNILKNEKEKLSNNERDKNSINKNGNKNLLFNNINNLNQKEKEVKIINNLYNENNNINNIKKLYNTSNNSEKNNDYNKKETNNNIEKNNNYNKKETNNKKPLNKDPEVILASSSDYLEETRQTTSHHKSNKYHSKSVNPYANTTTNEVFQITNSLIGLNNLGSTCYMNSALQNIIHCKQLIEKLISIKVDNSRINRTLTNSFINLCYNMIEKNYSNESKYISSYIYSLNSFSPSNFKKQFCLKHNEYIQGQHDSIEFLRTLLDDISKEINVNKNIYKELTTEGKSKMQQNIEYHNFFIGRENSFIIDIFYIQIINIFTCKCGYESYSFQKLLDIPLLLPMKIREINLISLIKEYLKEESLDWSSKCEKCKELNLKHIKKIKFSMLNDVIIFSLQRFDPYYSMKSSAYVSYEEIVDLKDFCDFDLYKHNTKYRLFGTINHIGNINYGHYFAYVRIGEIWYEFNDSIVKKINCIDLKSSSVCVLFYEKL